MASWSTLLADIEREYPDIPIHSVTVKPLFLVCGYADDGNFSQKCIDKAPLFMVN